MEKEKVVVAVKDDDVTLVAKITKEELEYLMAKRKKMPMTLNDRAILMK